MNEKALETYVELVKEKITNLANEKWEKPWLTPKCGLPQNISGRAYNNTNKLFLYMLMEKKNWELPVFMTFPQALNEGCAPLKGSKGFPVLHFDISAYNVHTKEKITIDEYNHLPNAEKDDYRIYKNVRTFTVFNVEQTNLSEVNPDKFNKIKEKFTLNLEETKGKSNELIDKMIDENKWLCPIDLKMQDSSYYVPSQDRIVLPLKNQFKDKESFYGTCLHEMAHSTGADSRLNRNIKNVFGSPEYAKEELVAELTSSVVASQMGITKLPSTESATYVRGWLNSITSDPNYLNNVIKDIGKASGMIEETISKVNETASVKEETASVKEEIYSGSHKELRIAENKATIITNKMSFDATEILNNLQKHGIDYKAITSEQWTQLLKGQGLQLDIQNPNKTFSIQKEPSGYNIRCMNISLNKNNGLEL